MTKKIYRAGVIPFIEENGEVHMLFMKPSIPKFGGDSYQIAKGKKEEGESMEDTALREGQEELGLFEGNIIRLEEIGVWLGRTTFYIAQIKDKELFGDPHHETCSVKWLTLSEFVNEGRSLHIPIVKAAHRRIKRI